MSLKIPQALCLAGLFLLLSLDSTVIAGGNTLQLNSSNTGYVGIKWDERMFPIRWTISSDGYPNADSTVTDEEIYEAMKAAFDTWEALPTSTIEFEYAGVVDRRAAEVDGYNLVSFTDPNIEFPPGVAGFAVTYSFGSETTITEESSDLDGDGVSDIPVGTYPAGTIYDGNIVFKASLNYSVDGSTQRPDLQSIALHEVGHFIGLSHSSLDSASMFPVTVSGNIAETRSLAEDDKAYASKYYPSSLYAQSYGEITGQVNHGKTNNRILGAHVYTVDPITGEKITGAYTDNTGAYELPVKAGRYYLAIEPLDGDPEYLDPERINIQIANTLDTYFSEEFYDANESSVEADPLAALPLDVVAGAAVTDINFRTNVVTLPAASRVLFEGINYFSLPISVPENLYAFELLTLLGDETQINSIDRLNPVTGSYERATYFNGVPSGVDFKIYQSEGYLVHATQQKFVTFTGSQVCTDVSLDVGLNLIGIPCPAASFSAFDLLQAAGTEYEVSYVKKYDHETGAFVEARYENGVPAGVDFPVVNGEAYFVETSVAKSKIDVDGSSGLFPPAIAGISPGRAVPGALVSIIGQGFGDILDNEVDFNGVSALVISASPTVLNVIVPAGATTGPVSVSIGSKVSNTVNFIVETNTVNEGELGEVGSSSNVLLEGQVVNGSISTAGEEDRYTFIGLKDDIVTVEAEVLTPGLDLKVAIEAAEGIELIADQGSSGNNALIHNYRLSATGRYTIVVSSASSLATGSYALDLNIVNIETEAKISVLSGAAQTAVAGSDLPQPFEIYATGPSGKPLADVPITLTASNIGLPSSPADQPNLMNAGSTVIRTNGNGIAIVQATAPNEAGGNYEVVVNIPGLNPVAMEISTISEPVASIIVSDQFTDCGGEGCSVGEPTDQTYSIQYFSAEGNPISNVFTQWKVVAGDGSLHDFSPGETVAGSGNQLSDENGFTTVQHVLGTKLYSHQLDNGTPIKSPQAVVALVSGQAEPILFTVDAKAGAPANIETNNSAYQRISYDTYYSTAIRVVVTDAYNNPVENATIDLDSDDLRVFPGLLDGAFIGHYKTDELGRWVGSVGASGVTPTIDEFGQSGSPGFADTFYTVRLNVDGLSDVTYSYDVDMGPSPSTNFSGVTQFLTKGFTGARVNLVRYQRRDSNGDGDWSNDDFTTSVQKIGMDDVPISLSISRLDGKDVGSLGFAPATINDETSLDAVIDDGFFEFSVDMGDVAGGLFVVAKVKDPVRIQFENGSGDPLGEPVEFPLINYGVFGGSFVAAPINVVVTLDADELSGIDWETLNITFNDVVDLFGGDADSIPLNSFPNYLQVYLGGSLLSEWPSAELLAAGGFDELRIEFQPTGQQLNDGINEVKISGETISPDGVEGEIFREAKFAFDEETTLAPWVLEHAVDGGSLTQVADITLDRTEFSYEDTTIDSFREIGVVLQNESTVSVELLDGELEPVKTLIASTQVPSGPYRFIVLREDLDSTSIVPRADTDFHIRVVTKPVDPSQGSESITLYRGELISNVSSEMLGQVIQHDTLLQRGAVTLSRQDLELKGAGPQLNFVRSYSNTLREENKESELGHGWTHNHNTFLKVLAFTDGQPVYGNNLPGWIAQTRSSSAEGALKLLSLPEYQAISSDEAVPSMVHVSNGGTFKFDTTRNSWTPQRGYHGTLIQEDVLEDDAVIGRVWVYTSKDGTRYQFEENTYNRGRHYVDFVEDRNGNRMRYEYNTAASFSDLRRVDKVIDQSGRVLKFHYVTVGGDVRLDNVSVFESESATSDLGIALDFEYYTADDQVGGDAIGMLKRFSRDAFSETYSYSQKMGDSVPNLASVTDVNNRTTYYKYYSYSPGDATDTARINTLNDYVAGLNPYDLVEKICYPTDAGNESCNDNYARISYTTSRFNNSRVVFDLRGASVTYALNDFGNPQRVEEPHGKVTEYVWSVDLGEPDNVMREMHDLSIDAKWEYEYDAKGNLIQETDPYGKTTVQDWDQNYAVLLSRKDKNDYVFTQQLDEQGNVRFQSQQATVDGLETTVVTEHTYGNSGAFNGLRLSTINARGKATAFDYDDFGNVEKITEPYSTVTRYENNARGLRTDEYDPNNNHTQYAYDNLDRLDLVIDAEGNTIDYEYDDKGNKTSEETIDRYSIDSDIYTRTQSQAFTYDARDRVESITRSGGVTGPLANDSFVLSGAKSFVYDGNSNVISETDWNLKPTIYSYDFLNRRLTTTDRLQNTMRYQYDFIAESGLRKTTTDFENRVSIEQHDLLGRLVEVTHPEVTHIDNTVGQYARVIGYDNLENITSVIDENEHKTEYVYDARYLKIEQIDALTNSYIWHYDEVGNQVGTVDEEQRVTRYQYDDLNRPEEKNAPENHNWLYTYYDNGTVETESDPWGFSYSYTYNAINQRTSVSHPDGVETESYTKDGQLIYHSDAEGRTSTTVIGPENRVYKQIDAVGRATTNTYDNNNNIVNTVLAWDNATTGPSLVATGYVYDLLDRLKTLREAKDTPVERLTEYTYDKVGNVRFETQPEGRVTETQYDELNRAKRIINPEVDDLGRNLDQIFDGVGNLVKVVNRDGSTRSYVYDELNRQKDIVNEFDNVTSFTYDKVGNVEIQTDMRGVITETSYDDLNRVKEVFVDGSTADGDVQNKTRFRLFLNEYDTKIGNGQRQNAVTDANGNRVLNDIDWRGNVLITTLPADDKFESATIVNNYDASGFLGNTIDASEFPTSYEYFDDGTVQSITNAEAEMTQYAYDLFANEVNVIKPKGANYEQRSTYDARNRLSRIVDANGHVTRFEYDVNNNLRHQYQPAANDSGDEVHVEYVYDLLNRKRQHIQHKSIGNLVTTYDYNEWGLITDQEEPEGNGFNKTYRNDLVDEVFYSGDILFYEQAYAYDDNKNPYFVSELGDDDDETYLTSRDLLNRVVKYEKRYNYAVAYTYDNNGNRLSVTSPGGTTTYTYDSRNRLDTVTAGGLTTEYFYFQNGWLRQVDHGNQTSVAYTYDNVGRVDTITNTLEDGSVLSSFEYDYDDNGNRTQQIETQNGFASNKVVTTDYLYDVLDRLESFTHTSSGNTETHTYSYYPSYDRKTETVTQNETITSDRTYTYDETYWLTTIADVATGGGIVYTYDNNGNTKTKTDTTGAGPESTLFTYNARNELTSTSSGMLGSEVDRGTHVYAYTGMRTRHLGSERGNVEYIYDGQSIIDEVVNNTAIKLAHYRYGDRLLSLNTTSGEQFYHYANVGATANLTNAAGENQVAYRVDPFGKITEQEGESVNRHVFMGQEHDEQTGLIYFGARFLDPDVGRWLTQDSYLGESNNPPSLHRYNFVYSNPNYYVDPDGHQVYQWKDDNGKTHFSDKPRDSKLDITVGEDLAGDADQQRIDNRQKNQRALIAKYACKDSANCQRVSTGDATRDARIQAAADQSVMTSPILTKESNTLNASEFSQGTPGQRRLKTVHKEGQAIAAIGATALEVAAPPANAKEAGFYYASGGVGYVVYKVGNKAYKVLKSKNINSSNTSGEKNLPDGLLGSDLSKDIKSYLSDIEKTTNRKFTPQQLKLLKADLRENSYSRLSKEGVDLNRLDFERKLPRIRKEWEKNTRQSWPKESYIDKNGKVRTRNYDAHHVIENKFGGKAEWWNITPAMRGVEHQGGIHRSKGPAEKLFGR